MKVEKVDFEGTFDRGSGVKSRASGEDFSKILDELTKGELSISGSKPAFVESIEALDINGLENRLDNRKEVDMPLNKLEEVIDKLEIFTSMLSSPSFDAKAFDNVLRSTSDAFEELEGIQFKGDLGNIYEEVRVLLFTESIKWKRGDYL